MSTKQDVVKWLRDVSTGEVNLGSYGICDELNSMLESFWDDTSILDFIKDSMQRYAEDNGTSRGYPVPHPALSHFLGYVNHAHSGSSMNDTSEYGLSRRKLAAWLANELEKSDVG